MTISAGGTRTFAVLEFKRPGCIQDSEWTVSQIGQNVSGSAKMICQQLSKYAYNHDISKVALCDLNNDITETTRGHVN